MDYLFAVLAGYALGSLPFAYWLAWLRGVDLRSVGSGNPGGANLFRQVSKPFGVLAVTLDGAKGALAALVGDWLGLPQGALVLPGMASVVGHWHSPLLRFGGGAGLATTVGVGLAISPIAAAIAVGVSVAGVVLWHNVGRASAVGWVTFLGVALGLRESWYVVLELMAIGFIVLGRSMLVERLAARRRGGI